MSAQTTQNIEIERKFLVKDDSWKKDVKKSYNIEQGYPSFGPRVRIRDDEAFLTIKTKKSDITNYEWEYEIPVSDAREMMDLADIKLTKTRHLVDVDSHTWELDVFHGSNDGLIICEIELSSEDETFTKPDWLGEEVSGDKRYSNKQIAKKPFSTWQ